jgi:hypothetical protein
MTTPTVVEGEGSVKLPTNPRFKDLTGKVFGRWTVESYAGTAPDTRAKWNCLCSCGTSMKVRSDGLLAGRATSCGCLKSELASERFTKHGGYGTYLYYAWAAVLQRCSNSSNPEFKNYGGRGITVDSSFIEFTGFREYVLTTIGERPTVKHSLDRINNEDGYVPGNLRWAVRVQQQRNKRNNHLVTYLGTVMTLVEACELSGVPSSTVLNRMSDGWSEEKALSTPIKKRSK